MKTNKDIERLKHKHKILREKINDFVKFYKMLQNSGQTSRVIIERDGVLYENK